MGDDIIPDRALDITSLYHILETLEVSLSSADSLGKRKNISDLGLRVSANFSAGRRGG